MAFPISLFHMICLWFVTLASRMVVMYLGAVMEEGPALDIYEFPQHPYSKALTKMVGEVVPRAPIGRIH